MENAGTLEDRGEAGDGGQAPECDEEPSYRARLRIGTVSLGASLPRVSQVSGAQPVLDEPEHHADFGRAEPDVPVDVFAQEPADERADERAGVDARVENREAGVASGSALRIQVSHHGAHVGLQEAGSADDQGEPDVEAGDGRNRHAEVAGRDDAAAQEDGVALPEDPVGDPASRESEEINPGRVEPVDCRGFLIGHPEAACLRGGHEEQNQDASHPVVAEPLPHLGEEERGEAARMSEPLSSCGRGGSGS